MFQLLPVSQRKNEILRRVVGEIDYSREGLAKLYTFKGDYSFFDCLLPSLEKLPSATGPSYVRDVLDEEMKTYLEKRLTLNRVLQTIRLHAVKVPKDGNCLLHAVSVAVWSVDDSRDILRNLMFISLKTDVNLLSRWRSFQTKKLRSTDNDLINKSWDELVDNVIQHSAGTSIHDVPSRFSDSFYIYVLANILRRPIIIITDTIDHCVTGSDDLGGMYLPLEWEPIECCKTPVIIGYSFKCFYSLISENCLESVAQISRKEDTQLFPLVNSDLGLLLVRCLKEQEVSKAWELAQSYLLIKEVDVPERNGNLSTVLCAQVKLKPLMSRYNLLCGWLDLLKESRADVAHYMSSYARLNSHNDTVTGSPTEITSFRLVHDRLYQQEHPGERIGTRVDLCLEQKSNQQRVPGNITQQNNQFREHNSLNPVQTSPGNVYHPKSTSEIIFNRPADYPLLPTAPLPSLEPQSYAQMSSMMPDRCKTGCGYRCSAQTYPFCHDCYHKEVQRGQAGGGFILQSPAPVVGSSNTINVITGTTLNHALTPTAPPLSIPLQSLEQTEPVLNYQDDKYSNQSYPSTHENHKTKALKMVQQDISTGGVQCESLETVGSDNKLKELDIGMPVKIQNNKCDFPPPTKGISLHEKEVQFISGTNIASENKSAGKSFYGSQIYQASEECNNMGSHHQHSDEVKVESGINLGAVKWNPKTLTQNHSQMSEQSVLSTDTETFDSENYLSMIVSRLGASMHNEEMSSPNKKHNKVPLDTKLSANKTSAATELYQRLPNHSSSLISHDNKTHPYPGSASSTNDRQSSVYSGLAQPVSHGSLPSLHSSMIYQTIEDTESTFTVVTNMTRHNASRSTDKAPTVFTNIFYHEPTMNREYHEETSFEKYHKPTVSGKYKESTLSANYKESKLCEKYENPTILSEKYEKPTIFKKNHEPILPEKYQIKENKKGTSAVKCMFPSCSSYSSSSTNAAGYCDSCHKVIRRQRILEWEAKQGVDVPDG